MAVIQILKNYSGSGSGEPKKVQIKSDPNTVTAYHRNKFFIITEVKEFVGHFYCVRRGGEGMC
jgi:hypothetical protein